MRRAEVYYQNRLAGIITEHEEGYKPVGGDSRNKRPKMKTPLMIDKFQSTRDFPYLSFCFNSFNFSFNSTFFLN